MTNTSRPARPASVLWPSVVVYIVIAFGLAWLVSLPLWLTDLTDPDANPIAMQLMAQGIATGIMFTPAIATLVVVFALKTPRQHRARFLGLWPLRPAKRVVWFIVGGLVAPIFIVVVSLAIAAACGWITLDLKNFSGLAEAMGGAPIGMSMQTLVAMQLMLIPLAATFNMIPAFGEEIGWRGWLLPALMPLGTWPALILSGVIWGLWHSPLILLGHNFGLLDWRGVGLMVVGCVCWGILFGWARLRSGSVWPAVIGHGSLNAAAGLFALVGAAGDALSLPLVNPLGVAGWIAIAVSIVILLLAGQFGKQPELGPKRSVGPVPETGSGPTL